MVEDDIASYIHNPFDSKKLKEKKSSFNFIENQQTKLTQKKQRKKSKDVYDQHQHSGS
jgi:hypothetical protein